MLCRDEIVVQWHRSISAVDYQYNFNIRYKGQKTITCGVYVHCERHNAWCYALRSIMLQDLSGDVKIRWLQPPYSAASCSKLI